MHVFVLRRGSGIHEQDVEHPPEQPGAQGRNLLRLIDVERLDLDPAGVIFRKIVQLGPVPGPNGPDDVPSLCQEFRSHCVAEAARGADEEDRGSD
jgi:hypothetical protein